MKNLSKSRIMYGLQCEKRLYLEVYRRDLIDYGASAQRILEYGNRVGEVARDLFPGGHLVEHDLELNLALEETDHLLKENFPGPIYEATFEHGGVLVRADVLLRNGDGFRVIEVKSSTKLKDYYIQDAAIQAWVMEGAGCPPGRVEVAHVNNQFVYPGGGNYDGLLTYVDVGDMIPVFVRQVPGWVDKFQAMLAGDMPEIQVGPHCNNPNPCPFINFCAPESDGPEFPVTCLPRGGKIAHELIEEGITDIRDIPPGRLTNKTHEMVRRATVSGEPFVDNTIYEEFRGLEYPRYYLDFETAQFAVPEWPGTRPYQQLPFQWSLHIEKAPGELDHFEFLDVSGKPPMEPLARQLLEAVGDSGPIVVYSGFEKAQLNQMAGMFPDIAPAIGKVVDRLVDACQILKKYYYHPDMKGSWSIKKVLPVVAPDMNYSDLDEVSDGGAAQNAYEEATAPGTAPGRREELRKKLLEYCKYDTLAMVKLVYYFQK